ncbi:MAG: glycosyltransferase family 39 protein [Elusimicrobia bacterium]|nr:glycosyltransferase family 39 protein [Elusimicrobiota bacterium]
MDDKAKFDFGSLVKRFNLFLVSAALSFNISACWALFSNVPLSDPGGFPELAKNSSFFYDSGIREPVPVLLVKIMQFLRFNDEFAVRLATALVFIVSGFLILYFVNKKYGFLAGLGASMFFAVNPYAGYYGVQGVNNLTSGLFLLVFWYFLSKKDGAIKNCVITGAIGGFCMLTRLENILIVILILCIDLVLDFSRERLKSGGIILAAALVLTLPYLGYQQYKFKSPVYSHRIAARFWLNAETKAPLASNRFEGGPMNISSFMFRHGAVKSIKGVLRGYFKSFTHYVPRLMYYKFQILLLLAGMFFCFKRREYFLLLLFPVLILPITFIAGIDQIAKGSGIEMRFYMNAFWILCIYCGIGLADIVSGVLKKIPGGVFRETVNN